MPVWLKQPWLACKRSFRTAAAAAAGRPHTAWARRVSIFCFVVVAPVVGFVFLKRTAVVFCCYDFWGSG